MSPYDATDGGDPAAVTPTAGRAALDEDSRSSLNLHVEFSAFYRETVRKLTAFLINHGATLPVAADIAQDAMIKAYERWSDLRSPEAWVHVVASRAYIRRATDVREQPTEQVFEPTSLLPRPDAIGEWESRHDLLQLVKGLPHRQRQILAWTFSGYKPSEIAEQLELTPEAVRASLKKARRALAAGSGAEEAQQ
ncbi:sigma-70 family RNA polymerase sigma factor [Streptomyces sp. NPDC002138]|uniref:RNA polymerase sigma factor n=1 Tax=Streptomyces sp. NPDC002138 TaxID=3154410 RepID=UPI00332A0E09